jgi:hypothetical protein
MIWAIGHDNNPLHEDPMSFKPNYGRDRAERQRAARTRSEENSERRKKRLRGAKLSVPKANLRRMIM